MNKDNLVIVLVLAAMVACLFALYCALRSGDNQSAVVGAPRNFKKVTKYFGFGSAPVEVLEPA